MKRRFRAFHFSQGNTLRLYLLSFHWPIVSWILNKWKETSFIHLKYERDYNLWTVNLAIFRDENIKHVGDKRRRICTVTFIRAIVTHKSHRPFHSAQNLNSRLYSRNDSIEAYQYDKVFISTIISMISMIMISWLSVIIMINYYIITSLSLYKYW